MASPPPPPPPHVLVLPFPLYGHYTPLFNLASLLAASPHGITITFVTFQRFIHSIQHQHESTPVSNANFRLVSIPDDPNQPKIFDLSVVGHASRACREMRPSVELLMEKLKQENTPVSCIFSDSLIDWVQDLADSLRMPRIALWVSSLAESAVYLHVPDLLAKGLLPFKDGQILAVPISIPGVPALHRADFPSFLQVSDANNFMFQNLVKIIGRCFSEAELVVANTSYELEGPVIEILKHKVRSGILPVGPLFLLGNKKTKTESEDESRCLQWLDKRSPCSVLYVAFGSGACAELTFGQAEELAQGLEDSEVPFLWSFRPNLVKDKRVSSLIEAIRNRLKEKEERGLVVSWAPQERVLEHSSIGGFLTHCGWNSTQESIMAGIPMLCWPFGTDQFLHAKLIAEEWRIGFHLKSGDDGSGVERRGVASKVRSLIVSEEGKEARKRVCALGNAMKLGISSSRNVEVLVDKIWGFSRSNNNA